MNQWQLTNTDLKTIGIDRIEYGVYQQFLMPSNHSVFDFHTSDLSKYEEATPYAPCTFDPSKEHQVAY